MKLIEMCAPDRVLKRNTLHVDRFRPASVNRVDKLQSVSLIVVAY